MPALMRTALLLSFALVVATGCEDCAGPIDTRDAGPDGGTGEGEGEPGEGEGEGEPGEGEGEGEEDLCNE
ncbi:MAG TPA: hypothetical protein VGF99_04105, partial [Myxococcota bacterium]